MMRIVRGLAGRKGSRCFLLFTASLPQDTQHGVGGVETSKRLDSAIHGSKSSEMVRKTSKPSSRSYCIALSFMSTVRIMIRLFLILESQPSAKPRMTVKLEPVVVESVRSHTGSPAQVSDNLQPLTKLKWHALSGGDPRASACDPLYKYQPVKSTVCTVSTRTSPWSHE